MGVRYLYTFIKKNVPNGLFSVNMQDAVDEFKRKYPNETPTIVIDILPFSHHCFSNKHERLLGGRFNVYNERARNIFTRLKSLGVNLVIFDDGPTQEFKIEKKIERKNNDYYDGLKILHAIDDGLDLTGDLSEFQIMNMSTFFGNFKKIAKEFGELKIAIQRECDQDIVIFASKVNALAVLSNDTDFLIFEGNWRFWSIKDINFDNLTTTEYNKSALRATLSLQTQFQLALFASLAGNDFVYYEWLKNFHKRMSWRQHNFLGISEFIKNKLNSSQLPLSKLDENTLANLALDSYNRENGINAIKSCLNFYCLNEIENNVDNTLMAKYGQYSEKFERLFRSILINKIRTVHFPYQDLEKNKLMSLFNVIKTILRRIMGVLMKSADQEYSSRAFSFKVYHKTPYEPINIFPEYPTENVPEVLTLLFDPYGENADLDDLRWKLLCFIVSEKLNKTLLEQIPEENFINVLCLFYLTEIGAITLDEADCLLLSCNVPTTEQMQLQLNDAAKIDGRDARLSHFFGRFYCFMKNCLKVVGMSNYCVLLRFDGLYFHILRKEWKILTQNAKNEKLKSVESFRIYCRNF